MEEVWTLWSDESREGGHRPMVAAGLLLHADADDTLAAIRWEIEHQLPWVPWPLHATEFHRPGMQLAWMSTRLDAVPAELHGAVQRCVAKCSAKRIEGAFAVLKSRSSEGRAHRDWFSACRTVESYLSSLNDAAWARVVDATRVAERWLRALLIEAASSLQEEGLGYLVAATDGEVAPPVDLLERIAAGRRQTEWREVVTQLSTRGLDLLAAERADARLQLSPLAYRAKDSETGAVRTGDAGSLLDAVSQEVTRNRTGQSDLARRVRFRHTQSMRYVTVEPAVGHAYNTSSPTAHVWADWLAFELRSIMRRDDDLAILAGCIRSTVGWSVVSPQFLTTVAASGAASQQFGALRRGQPLAPNPSSEALLTWAQQQAVEVGPRAGVWGLS